MSLLQRAARNFSAQMFSFAISTLDRIVLTGVLVRAWGVEGFSDWATIWSTAALLVTAELGFQTYLGNSLVHAKSRDRHRAHQRLLELGLFFYLGFALLVTVLLVLVAAFADLGAALRLHARDLDVVVVILFFYQLLRIVRGGVTQVFRGAGEYHQLVITDVRSTGICVMMAVCAALLGASPLIVALLYVAGETVFGIGWAVVTIMRRHPHVRLRSRRPGPREMRAAGGKLIWYSTTQVNAYVMSNLPILIIAWLGMSGAGLTAFAVQRTLVNFSRTVAANFSAAAGVELATIDREKGRERLYYGVRTVGGMNIALAGLTAVGLFLFGEAVVGFWTGNAGLGSRTTLILLLLPVIAVAPFNALLMLSVYGALPHAQAIGTGVQMLVGLALCAVLGNIAGVEGVALGLAIGEIIGIGIVLPLIAARHFPVPLGKLALHSAAVFAGTVVWSSAVGFPLVALFPVMSLPGLVLELAVWGLLAAVPVFFLVLPVSQRRSLLAAGRRIIYGMAR